MKEAKNKMRHVFDNIIKTDGDLLPTLYHGEDKHKDNPHLTMTPSRLRYKIEISSMDESYFPYEQKPVNGKDVSLDAIYDELKEIRTLLEQTQLTDTELEYDLDQHDKMKSTEGTNEKHNVSTLVEDLDLKFDRVPDYFYNPEYENSSLNGLLASLRSYKALDKTYDVSSRILWLKYTHTAIGLMVHGMCGEPDNIVNEISKTIDWRVNDEAIEIFNEAILKFLDYCIDSGQEHFELENLKKYIVNKNILEKKMYTYEHLVNILSMLSRKSTDDVDDTKYTNFNSNILTYGANGCYFELKLSEVSYSIKYKIVKLNYKKGK